MYQKSAAVRVYLHPTLRDRLRAYAAIEQTTMTGVVEQWITEIPEEPAEAHDQPEVALAA